MAPRATSILGALGKHKTTGIVALAAIALAVVVALIIMLRKGLGGIFGGANAVGEGVGGLAKVAAAPFVAGGNIADAYIVAPTKQAPDANAASPGEYSALKPTLNLKVLRNKQKNTHLSKQNAVTVLVTSGGRPVPGATVHAFFPHSIVRARLGNQTRTTGMDGTALIGWTVNNMFGAEDDDARLTAKKTGYNPSNSVLVK